PPQFLLVQRLRILQIMQPLEPIGRIDPGPPPPSVHPRLLPTHRFHYFLTMIYTRSAPYCVKYVHRPSPATPAAYTSGRSAITVSIESASSAFLSRRQRAMLGKRTATPERWRVDRRMPSNAISKTSTGLTLRTGPKR